MPITAEQTDVEIIELADLEFDLVCEAHNCGNCAKWICACRFCSWRGLCCDGHKAQVETDQISGWFPCVGSMMRRRDAFIFEPLDPK